MRTGLWLLVRKELLGLLRNPQLIGSIVMIPLLFIFMGGITQMGVQKAAEEAKPQNIVVVVEDRGWLAERIAGALRAIGYHVVEAPGEKGDHPSGWERAPVIVYVPKGFTSRLELFLENKTLKPPSLRAVIRIDTVSFIATGRIHLADAVAETISRLAREALAEKNGLPQGLLSLEVGVEGEVLLHRHRMSVAEAAGVIGSLASSFFIALFVIALAAQYAVLSMAQEKEDKSFETLLSQPIPRSSIGFAKTIGALVVTAIQVALFAASWYYYMAVIASTPPPPEATGTATGQAPGTGPGETATLGLYQSVMSLLGVEGAAALLLELLLAAIAAALLGLIVGSLSRDTRSAGTAIGPLWLIVVGVGMTAQMVGVPLSPETGLLGATIVLGPPLAVQAAVAGDTASIATTLASTGATVALLAYVLSRILNSEAIVVGIGLKARLRLGRRSAPARAE